MDGVVMEIIDEMKARFEVRRACRHEANGLCSAARRSETEARKQEAVLGPPAILGNSKQMCGLTAHRGCLNVL
jgi:hypothetical protein